MKDSHPNREMSTLSYHERVLQEAEDPRNALMDRARFLGIYSAIMDEFFRSRVTSIRRAVDSGTRGKGAALDAVLARARALDRRFQRAYEAVVRALAGEGVCILSEDDIAPESDRASWLQDYFREAVLPNLDPVILDGGRDFPELVDGKVYFAVEMAGVDSHYALIALPADLGRFVQLPDGSIMYLDDAIRFSIGDAFPVFDYDTIDMYAFEMARDATLDIDDDFSEDYVRRLEEALASRGSGRPTRLVYDAAMPPALLDLIKKGMDIREDYALAAGGRYLRMKDWIDFPVSHSGRSLAAFTPASHPMLENEREPVLSTLAQRDVLVTAPYQAFENVLRLLRESAIDPRVDAIKISLYRLAPHSHVVHALTTAARNGKQVFVSIELQARLDEKRNCGTASRGRGHRDLRTSSVEDTLQVGAHTQSGKTFRRRVNGQF